MFVLKLLLKLLLCFHCYIALLAVTTGFFYHMSAVAAMQEIVWCDELTSRLVAAGEKVW